MGVSLGGDPNHVEGSIFRTFKGESKEVLFRYIPYPYPRNEVSWFCPILRGGCATMVTSPVHK